MTPAAGSVTDRHDSQQLAERARAGSMDALAALYDTHSAGVYRVALRLLRSVSDAEDVVQDVFVGLPRALRSYRGEGRLDAWIRQVAARTALTRLRTQRNRREGSAASDERGARGADTDRAARPAHPLDRVALQRALDALPEDHRVVFMLKAVEGYSHDEIAGLLDITPAASRTRMARARKQLEHQLR